MIKFIQFIIGLSLLLAPYQGLWAENILGIGDSIALGTCSGLVGPWPELATLRGLSETTYNAGVGGNSAAQVDTRIGDLLTSVNPDMTVVIVGSNDVRFLGTTLESYLSSISSINTKIVNSGSTAVICQITPVSVMAPYNYGRNETGQQNEKLWNAALEDWCCANSVPMSANYQEMAYNDVSKEDDLYYDSTCADGVHVSVAGYTRMATLINSAAVPIRKRVYGHTSFPTICYNSWDWFILGSGASITGDADEGTLSLVSGATADGPVECLPSGSKYVQITATVASGTPAYYYRTSATTNFDRDDAAAWTAYSGGFTTTDQFVQVRATASGDATVSDLTLDWSESATRKSTASFHGGGGMR